ncbi:MAG: lytic transglycosylase domain-containing protein [Spirochaetes bacterium]|nr:lytic transglycosylase domain-containing protein [Spirochaetota bacterium]
MPDALRERPRGGIRRLSMPLLFAMALMAVLPGDAYCRIIRRVQKDGTIHLSNTRETARPSRKGRTSVSSRYDDLITAIASKEGLDPHLIKCIVKVESGFNPDAVSPAGAMGLMQIMQDTARHYNLEDPFDPAKNLKTGSRHFKVLMNHFRNDVPLALAAYHAGLGRVKRRMAIPPIRSTIDYVNSVMYLYNGSRNYDTAVMRLYKRIDRDGTILFYSK